MGWQQRSGYNRRSLVETAVYRYKTIIGRRLQARTLPKQRTEAKIGCNVLNRMTSFGMPVSARICRYSTRWSDDDAGLFVHQSPVERASRAKQSPTGRYAKLGFAYSLIADGIIARTEFVAANLAQARFTDWTLPAGVLSPKNVGAERRGQHDRQR